MLDDRICVCIIELGAVDMMLNYVSTHGRIDGTCIITVYVTRYIINIAKSNQGLDESLRARIGNKLNVDGSHLHLCKYQ